MRSAFIISAAVVFAGSAVGAAEDNDIPHELRVRSKSICSIGVMCSDHFVTGPRQSIQQIVH